MNAADTLGRFLTRYPSVAVAAYAAIAIVCLAAMWQAGASILEERAGLAGATEILAQLEARRQAPDAANTPAGAVPAGSPFLAGETITVAGAALLQRVADAVGRFGGSVQSSQVDLQGAQAKDSFVTLIISCEIDQQNLQKLLYDLEAGMPFLIIEQLIVTGPQTSETASAGRMKVLLAVSGQWKGAI
jgi:general secretion pathway protein M